MVWRIGNSSGYKCTASLYTAQEPLIDEIYSFYAYLPKTRGATHHQNCMMTVTGDRELSSLDRRNCLYCHLAWEEKNRVQKLESVSVKIKTPEWHPWAMLWGSIAVNKDIKRTGKIHSVWRASLGQLLQFFMGFERPGWAGQLLPFEVYYGLTFSTGSASRLYGSASAAFTAQLALVDD